MRIIYRFDNLIYLFTRRIVYISMLLIFNASVANAETYIIYNGGNNPIVSKAEYEAVVKYQTNKKHNDKIRKVENRLKKDLFEVKYCIKDGYLNIELTKQHKIYLNDYISQFNTLESFIARRYTGNGSKRLLGCEKMADSVKDKLKIINAIKKTSHKDDSIKIIIAPVPYNKFGAAIGANNASELHTKLYTSLGIIYEKKKMYMKAKKLMYQDGIALAAFLNRYGIGEYNLDVIASVSHSKNGKGIFSRVTNSDYLEFRANWTIFKNVGYKVSAIPVDKNSKLITIKEYYRLHAN